MGLCLSHASFCHVQPPRPLYAFHISLSMLIQSVAIFCPSWPWPGLKKKKCSFKCCCSVQIEHRNKIQTIIFIAVGLSRWTLWFGNIRDTSCSSSSSLLFPSLFALLTVKRWKITLNKCAMKGCCSYKSSNWAFLMFGCVVSLCSTNRYRISTSINKHLRRCSPQLSLFLRSLSCSTSSSHSSSM